ncbi:hypothetical protein [uncultured Croceitalea sp.]|uniref:hypothetical protein n=1 Tax=uncultured Croceitalea sp. TaxID=1798908 RepID=UPI00330614B5
MKTLELHQMENVEGGYECSGLAAGLKGAGYIFSVSAWWTGAGGGIGLALVTAGYIAQAAGC